MLATILPGFLLISLLGAVYARFGELKLLNNFFLGVLPAIVAVILSVAISMAQKQVKDYKQMVICIIAAIGLLTIHSFFATLGVIAASAFTGYLLYRKPDPGQQAITSQKFSNNKKRYIIYFSISLILFLLLMLAARFYQLNTQDWYKLNRTIFFTFSGMSLTLFGGGYVIIPAMQQVIVDGFHWMTTKEFADAIAMGQITPGPVILTATFVGYKVAGFLGACTATLAIFLPPGLLMLILSGFLNRIRSSHFINALFSGMRPAIIGMIFSAAVTVGKGAEMVWPSALIFLTVLILLLKYKVNVLYMIPTAGIAGMLLF
jgi:chromate transporter